MIAFLFELRYLSRPSLRISQQNCRICDSEIATPDNLLTNNDKVKFQVKFFIFYVDGWRSI